MLITSVLTKKTFNLRTLVLTFALALFGYGVKAQVVTPYRLSESGFYLVEVKVNDDQIFPFIVDTAAQNTSLYLPAIQALEIEPIPNQFVMIQGVNGQIKSSLHKISSIEMAGARMENIISTATPKFNQDDYHIGGVLGMDFLSGYQVEFNCVDQTIQLHDPQFFSIKEAELLDRLAFNKPFANFIFIDVEIQGEPSTAILDTGARRHLTNWLSAKKMGIEPGDTGLTKDDEVSGATGKFSDQASKFEFADIRILNQQWNDQTITIADVDVFDFFLKKNKPVIILGTPLFRHTRFVLDYQNNILSFLSTTDNASHCQLKS